MAEDDYAIVVGIDHYGFLKSLEGAVHDANRFKEWLIDPLGGAVPEANVALISSATGNQHDPELASPTTVEIDAAFRTLFTLADSQGGRAGRRLYVFMAGHGFGPQIDEAALLVANADGERRRNSHIPGRHYAQLIRSEAIFDELVLFMDCCRNLFPKATIRNPEWSSDLVDEASEVGWFYGFSTKWRAEAREQPLPPDDQTGGIFTWALIDALERAPADAQGHVTADAIEGYVHSYLREQAENTSSPLVRFAHATVSPQEFVTQSPDFAYDTDPQRRFIVLTRDAVATAAAATPIEITFTAPDEDQSVRLADDNFTVVDSRPSMEGSWQTAPLPSGRYILSAPGTGLLKPFDHLGKEVTHVNFP